LCTGRRPPAGLFAEAPASATGEGRREITAEDSIK
jgi:hypothetical protein